MSLFEVKTREEELEILKTDDGVFSNTKSYLDGMIKNAINLFVIDKKLSGDLYAKIRGDIPLAVKRFLENGGADKDYKFSTYFGWYIAQRIDPLKLDKK